MSRILRILLAAVLAGHLLVGQGYAQSPGLPTVDHPRYAIILKDLQAFSTQLKAWGSVVGAARTQIETLQKIADGIRDIENLVSGGIRGIAADITAKTGIGDVLSIMKEVQSVYSDAQSLIHDIQALPDQAKRRLEDIGIAAGDVQTFLREGLMYDTMNNLGADYWKAVAKDPVRSLETGSFGVALARSEDYLSPDERGRAWHDYITSLNESERERMGGLIGPQFAAHLADQWFSDMQRRVARSADLKGAANKMLAKIEAPTSAKSSEKDIAADISTLNASTILDLKVRSSLMEDYSKAALTINTAEKERTRLLRELEEGEQAQDSQRAMLRE